MMLTDDGAVRGHGGGGLRSAPKTHDGSNDDERHHRARRPVPAALRAHRRRRWHLGHTRLGVLLLRGGVPPSSRSLERLVDSAAIDLALRSSASVALCEPQERFTIDRMSGVFGPREHLTRWDRSRLDALRDARIDVLASRRWEEAVGLRAQGGRWPFGRGRLAHGSEPECSADSRKLANKRQRAFRRSRARRSVRSSCPPRTHTP